MNSSRSDVVTQFVRVFVCVSLLLVSLESVVRVKCVSRVFQECFKNVSRVSRLFQGCFKIVS